MNHDKNSQNHHCAPTSSFFCTPLWGDLSRLVLRLGFGLSLALGHGADKVMQFWTSTGPIEWADPIGVGAGASLFLAGSAECFASLLVVLGLGTRFAALGPLITMLVAVLFVHTNDPWAKKEMAFLYLVAYLAIALAGAGRFSLDYVLCRKKLLWRKK
jgi:putative oxidoreductase